MPPLAGGWYRTRTSRTTPTRSVFGKAGISGTLRAEPWARFVEGHPNPRCEHTSGSGSVASVRLSDLAAPGATLPAPGLDQLLEPVQILRHLTVVQAESRSDVLDHAFGLPVHLHRHPALFII
jgi:hypothetical protein